MRNRRTFLAHQISDRRNRPFLEIATTRPETMLGDSAMPYIRTRDKDIVGKNVLLPLVNKEIPVVRIIM